MLGGLILVVRCQEGLMGEAVATERDLFCKLELLNVEIDVLIDEEGYDEVKDKLGLSEDAETRIAKCFNDPVCTQETAEDWRDALSIKGNQWPVVKVGDFQLNDTDRRNECQKRSFDIRQGWSALFWAKLLRAKIQERNTDCYLRRLDDVVAYLERNLPPEPSQINKSESIPHEFKLYFYYLMELSAASIDYGSIGYATRASRILAKIPPFSKTENECNYFSFPKTAKRWIALNEGVSYLHLSDYHKASLEFNDIIWKYRKCIKSEENQEKYYLGSHELTLLYYPAVLYRAIILLKQQFSYHAIQTLRSPSGLDNWTDYKKVRKDLLIAQAYRQLERRKSSTNELKDLGEKLFQNYTFPIKLDNKNRPRIPNYYEYIPKRPRSEMASYIRYVELAVNEFLEIVKCVGFSADHIRTQFRFWVEGKPKEIDYSAIANGLEDVKDMYSVMNDFLPWVENNSMDRAGYYRQMAELLAWSAHIIVRWQEDKERLNKGIPSHGDDQVSQQEKRNRLKQLAMDLENKLKKHAIDIMYMIVHNEEGSGPEGINSRGSGCAVCSDMNRINLARLRSEDYLSFVGDIISVFGKKEAREWFTNLRRIKVKIAEAVAEKERTKGEDLHINRLRLRNDLALYHPVNDCAWCMDDKLGKPKFEENFRYLTSCRHTKDMPKRHWQTVSRLIRCFRQVENIELIEGGKRLSGLDYDQIMEAYEDEFQRHLNKPTKHYSPPSDPKNSNSSPNAAVHFFGLRRWNSISPAEGLSLGGGYLLFRTNIRGVIDLGVAIDPGYDFIKNLFHCGFSLTDIDVILLSHGHPDHVRDFGSMINLLKELEDRTGEFRRVSVLLTLGTYERLQHVFSNQALRRHVDPLVIDIEKDIDRDYFKSLGNPGTSTSFHFIRKEVDNYKRGTWRISLEEPASGEKLTVMPTRAYHNDYSGVSDSFGFVLEIPTDTNGTASLLFGYTGDTKWVGKRFYSKESAGYCPEEISKQYADCDVLLIHMGSLIDHKSKQRFSDSSEEWRKRCEGIVRKKNHPYLPGLLGFFNEVYDSGKGKPCLILLSEFGEELRGTIRTDLVKRLNGVYGPRDGSKPWCHILPVDVGLDVVCQLEQSEASDEQNNGGRFIFWCAQCRRFHPVENIAYRHYGQDESIFYLCQTCDKTISPDVLQDRLRHLYEIGRTLRTDE